LRAVSLDDLVREALETVEEVQPEEVARLLETPGREEADEFEAGHLPGARHLPRGFLEVRADLVHTKRDPWLADRERKLVLYCGGGNRSALAAQSLLRMGFTCVRSMVEGFAGWTKRGYTIVGPPAS
jgi:rhodanese-related sulfurtransferase